ncbi:hypothetical protein [Chelativorans oligotrophicus]|nr:hypothetical protein [Chelativorans oligotrophicus]
MSAREIIQQAVVRCNQFCDQTYASAVLNELAAAGYRLVAPGELDDETLERAVVHLLEISQAMWDRAETKRPADGWERPPEGEKDDAVTAWCFEKAANAIRPLKADRRALEGDGRG